MMELVDMPGMSAKFRICRMRTADFKKVGRKFNGSFSAPKLGGPEYPFGDVFSMRGGRFRKKCPLLPRASTSPHIKIINQGPPYKDYFRSSSIDRGCPQTMQKSTSGTSRHHKGYGRCSDQANTNPTLVNQVTKQTNHT